MIPAATPTTSHAPEETAPAAPIPLPVDEIKDAPLEVTVTNNKGLVLMAFTKPIVLIDMTPKLTRQLIRQLSKNALEADRNRPGKR